MLLRDCRAGMQRTSIAS
jgi:hypothetical protein